MPLLAQAQFKAPTRAAWMLHSPPKALIQPSFASKVIMRLPLMPLPIEQLIAAETYFAARLRIAIFSMMHNKPAVFLRAREC